MIYLIVPPILIIFAVAILIIFLTKVTPSDDVGNFILKKDTKAHKDENNRKNFLRATSAATTDRIKKTFKKNDVFMSKNGTSKFTQGILSNKTSKKIVSLRKKSMVSDKIENAEGRDPAELELMKQIENDPQNSKEYEKLGDYYMEHEQFEDARECYKYVLRLDPRHKRAQVAMRNLDRVLNTN